MVKKHLRPHWRGLPTSRSSRRLKQAARQEGLEIGPDDEAHHVGHDQADKAQKAGYADLTLCTIFFIAFFDDLGFLS